MCIFLYSERDIPTEAQVKAHGGRLMDTMDPKNFLSYAGTFSTVGLLWHVNHSLFDVSSLVTRSQYNFMTFVYNISFHQEIINYIPTHYISCISHLKLCNYFIIFSKGCISMFAM